MEEGERRRRARGTAGAEGADMQGRDPHIPGHPLEWGSHLKLLGSELTNL